jgi:hypothetical protein
MATNANAREDRVVTPKSNPSVIAQQKAAQAARDASAAQAKKVTQNKNSDAKYFQGLWDEYNKVSADIDSRTGTKIIDDDGAAGKGGRDGGGGLSYDELLKLQLQQQAADKALAEANKPTLALDTFRATLGLIFGKEEANKSYVSKLYSLTSGFYKTGSTVEEAMNLALYQAENEGAIPEFTSRFAGIFALRDAKKNGAAITVPTIAEFFATEAKMGEVLTNAGLGELATESFLGGVIGKNKSVNEVATLISDVFNTIDYAPKELKQTLSTYFPGVDRVSIAKAILTGPEGAQALSQKIKGVSVMSAAQQYGMNIDMTTATDIANRGYDYNAALTGYGQVSSLGRANTIAEFTGGQFTQEQAQNAVFMKNANDLAQLSTLKNVEEARFQGSSGASKGAFSTQYLNKGSSAGQF